MRNACILMANAGVPVEVRQKFTGHASAEMNVHYTHHEIETLRSAIGKLPTLRPNADAATLARPRRYAGNGKARSQRLRGGCRLQLSLRRARARGTRVALRRC